MIPFLMTTAVTALAAGSFILWYRSYPHDSLSRNDGWLFLGFMLSLCALTIAMIGVIYAINLHINPKACERYGVASQRETKYVRLSWWDTGSCLVRIGDRWIDSESISNVELTELTK